jgi:uncharacterized protein YegL
MPIQDLEGVKHKPMPVIFLIDVSYSMEGLGIQQVNINMKEYIDALKVDTETKDSVQLTIITFSDEAELLMKFKPISDVDAPVLKEQGSTDLAIGIAEVMSVIRDEADFIKSECKRPLLVFISDGNATCSEESWRDEVREMNNDFIMKRAVRVALGAGSEIKDSTLEAFILNKETDKAARIADMNNLSEFFKYLRTITKEIVAGKQPSKLTETDDGAGTVVLID